MELKVITYVIGLHTKVTSAASECRITFVVKWLAFVVSQCRMHVWWDVVFLGCWIHLDYEVLLHKSFRGV